MNHKFVIHNCQSDVGLTIAGIWGSFNVFFTIWSQITKLIHFSHTHTDYVFERLLQIYNNKGPSSLIYNQNRQRLIRSLTIQCLTKQIFKLSKFVKLIIYANLRFIDKQSLTIGNLNLIIAKSSIICIYRTTIDLGYSPKCVYLVHTVLYYYTISSSNVYKSILMVNYQPHLLILKIYRISSDGSMYTLSL